MVSNHVLGIGHTMSAESISNEGTVSNHAFGGYRFIKVSCLDDISVTQCLIRRVKESKSVRTKNLHILNIKHVC